MRAHVTLAAFLAVAGLAPAIAQSDSPQVERHELMEDIGDAAKVMGDMAKGTVPFDSVEVQEALTIVIDNAKVFPTLFPEGSETGNDTRALPAIWENKADFEEKANDLVVAAEAARGAADNGLDSFRAAFGKIGETCRACHTDYRAEKE